MRLNEYARWSRRPRIQKSSPKRSFARPPRPCWPVKSRQGGRTLDWGGGRHPRTSVAARAQFLLGDVRYHRRNKGHAITEFTRVLTQYFEADLADIEPSIAWASASTRWAVTRKATSAYQAVVPGNPVVGVSGRRLSGRRRLLDQKRAAASVPYFRSGWTNMREGIRAGRSCSLTPNIGSSSRPPLCLPLLRLHKYVKPGELSGMPHIMMLRDAAQRRHRGAATRSLSMPTRSVARAVSVSGRQCWKTCGRSCGSPGLRPRQPFAGLDLRQGGTSEGRHRHRASDARALRRAQSDIPLLAGAYLNKEQRLVQPEELQASRVRHRGFPGSLLRASGQDARALSGPGLTYYRLNRSGDAVDRWELLVSIDSKLPSPKRHGFAR